MSFSYCRIYCILFLLSVSICTFAQQTNPFLSLAETTSTAPTWSGWPGEGAPLRGSGINNKWSISGRFVDTEMERPRWRFTLNYRIHQKLQFGLEYNPVIREVRPIFNLFLMTEGESIWRPALFLGTSSDRIGSPADKQAYFLTLSKGLPIFPVSVYVTLNYSEWNKELGKANVNIPFGMTANLGQYLSVRPMYDGDRFHLM